MHTFHASRMKLRRTMNGKFFSRNMWKNPRTFRLFSLSLVLLLPFYPSLSVLGSSETDVGDYDESSIITAYDYDWSDEGSESWVAVNDAGNIVTTETSDVPTKPRTQFKIHNYTVQEGDSYDKIAEKYGISGDTILWVNDLNPDSTLKVGQNLRIPPVSGVVYTVRDGDTLSEIAVKYGISARDISDQNALSDDAAIRIGQELVIPWAKKFIVKEASKSSSQTIQKDIPSTANKKTNAPKSSYKVEQRWGGKWFAWGNCTYYVAQHKNVTWRGNAKQWIRNAKAQWIPTGQEPAVGAIIQFSGGGYNPYYWHVGIVVSVSDDEIIVKDMNYRALNEVTVRHVDRDDSAIDGFIYVD